MTIRVFADSREFPIESCTIIREIWPARSLSRKKKKGEEEKNREGSDNPLADPICQVRYEVAGVINRGLRVNLVDEPPNEARRYQLFFRKSRAAGLRLATRKQRSIKPVANCKQVTSALYISN